MIGVLIIIASPLLVYLFDSYMKSKYNFHEVQASDIENAKKRTKFITLLLVYNKQIRYFGIILMLIGFIVIGFIGSYSNNELSFFVLPVFGAIIYGLGVTWKMMVK